MILARALSRRFPGKNVTPLMGVPLIAYVGRAALASRIDRVVLSTESDSIAAVAAEHGIDAPFRRPVALAADFARSEQIVGHALDTMEATEDTRYEVVVTLQPTTPFVLPEHIDACLDAVAHAGAADGDVATCFTARRVTQPPQWMFTRGADGTARLLMAGEVSGDREHSQLLEPCYVPNGAAYATRTGALRAQDRIICDPARLVVMEDARSIDIDEPLDLVIAEAVGTANGFGLVASDERSAVKGGLA